MLGLKTQENSKFINFFNIVQKEASNKDSVFFIFCGEGNDGEFNNMELENLSGWLIPFSEKDEFEQIWLENSFDEKLSKWENDFVFCRWKIIGVDKLEIEFD